MTTEKLQKSYIENFSLTRDETLLVGLTRDDKGIYRQCVSMQYRDGTMIVMQHEIGMKTVHQMILFSRHLNRDTVIGHEARYNANGRLQMQELLYTDLTRTQTDEPSHIFDRDVYTTVGPGRSNRYALAHHIFLPDETQIGIETSFLGNTHIDKTYGDRKTHLFVGAAGQITFRVENATEQQKTVRKRYSGFISC